MPAFTTRLRSRATVATDVVDLVFDLVNPPKITFQAGQFVTLAVGTDEAGQPLRRSYSIASMGDQGEHLRFILRVISEGAASTFFTELPLGASVEMTGPHGFFVLAPHHPGDVVFAATGTGVAPVLPMLGELQRRKDEAGRRLVFWGLRHESDLFVPEEIQQACLATGASLQTYLSRPSAAWTGHRGRITAAVLEQLPSLQQPTFYLVGNGAMIAELKAGLVAAGIDRRKQIRTEAFFD
jgi:CDP-4-dehydro-6-deoxyglucose reductase, E3